MAVRSLSLLLSFLVLALCGVASAQNGIVEDIQIHGNRRIPADTIRARIFTRPGDIYDQNGIVGGLGVSGDTSCADHT